MFDEMNIGIGESLPRIENPFAEALTTISSRRRSYAWASQDNGAATPSHNALKTSVQQAFNDMTAKADETGIDRPDTMCALHTPGHGTIYHSSIKGAKGSVASQDLLDSCPHRYNGNCAEMGALAQAKSSGYTLAGSLITVYGVTNKNTQATGFMSPCKSVQDGTWGCGNYVDRFGLFPVTKRDVEEMMGKEGMTLKFAKRSIAIEA